MRVRLSGHPEPILLGDKPRLLSEAEYGVALGVTPDPLVITSEVALTNGWAVLLYTDGLFEGRVGNGKRLGLDGLVDMIRDLGESFTGHALLNALVARACELNRGPLADDVALLWLASTAVE
jgi:serine phosphatase RsbU (regulator of sigma subunit)